MICVPISRNSRGSIALTLPCVPTDINTGVSTTPWAVVSFPTRALDEESVFRSWNMGLIGQTGGWIDGLMDCWIVGLLERQEERADSSELVLLFQLHGCVALDRLLTSAATNVDHR